ncbi:MAG: fused DSP-PTPase phosphatase/NAD kinase-like protein, partial [Acidimicrobiales bacterium]
MRLAVLALGLVALPNAAILGLHLWAARAAQRPAVSLPIRNFAEVDGRLWRGAAPGAGGIEALASNGVTTIVDLRAEEDLAVDQALLDRLSVRRVH